MEYRMATHPTALSAATSRRASPSWTMGADALLQSLHHRSAPLAGHWLDEEPRCVPPSAPGNAPLLADTCHVPSVDGATEAASAVAKNCPVSPTNAVIHRPRDSTPGHPIAQQGMPFKSESCSLPMDNTQAGILERSLSSTGCWSAHWLLDGDRDLAHFMSGRPLYCDGPTEVGVLPSYGVHPYCRPADSAPSLQKVASVPGVGGLIMASLPLMERLRLRGLCSSFQLAVDESLETLETISGQDVAAAFGSDDANDGGDGGGGKQLGGNGRNDGTVGAVGGWSGNDGVNVSNDVSVSDDTEGGNVGLATSDSPDQACSHLPMSTRHGLLGLIRGPFSSPPDPPATSRAPPTSRSATETKGNGYHPLSRSPDREGLEPGSAPSIWVISAGNGDLAGGLNGCGDANGATAMLWLIDRCPNLQSLAAVTGQPLELTLARRARPDGWWQSPVALTQVLAAVGTKCRRLRALDVERCGGVTDEGIRAITAGCPDLEHLNVACCNVTDASVSAIAASCPRLAFLKVAGCNGVTDASIAMIAERCPLLEYLEVSGCKAVTDASIKAVARNCPRLRYLLVEKEGPGVTDASIEEVARNCRQLELLDVAGSRGVTDRSITLIARGCARLRHLAVHHCHYVTDVSITAVAQGCPDLEHLDVRRCIGVTDASVKVIAHSCTRLRQLGVAECKGVTDASIERLARNCPRLRHLDAAFCPRVTDYSVMALAQRCGPRGLQHVDLCRCDVTDNSMAWLAAHCPRLRHLDVSGCERVTSDGVSIVGGACAQLRYLFAAGCKGVLREEMGGWFPPGCKAHC